MENYASHRWRMANGWHLSENKPTTSAVESLRRIVEECWLMEQIGEHTDTQGLGDHRP